MSKKHTYVCMACGKTGHRAVVGQAPWRAYLCPFAGGAWGDTGTRTADGGCSACGCKGFAYGNGLHVSRDGVRGYRCLECGTIKPEQSA